METRSGELNPDSEIGKVERRPVLERLRVLTDRIKFRENQQYSWSKWRQTIIDNREEGIPEGMAPKSFAISNTFLDIFQEMLPVKTPGEIDSKLHPKAAYNAKKGVEVSRSIVMDASKRHLLVNVINGGKPTVIEGRSGVMHGRLSGEIGSIHTHPTSDNLPSSVDLTPYLYDRQALGYILTPYRAIGIFRTDRTPEFANREDAKEFLQQIGTDRGKLPTPDGSSVWTPDYKDLNKLHILAYEAQRNSNLFVRKK